MNKWTARAAAAVVAGVVGMAGGIGPASAVSTYSASDIASWGEGWKFSVSANIAGDYDEMLFQLPADLPHRPYPDRSGNYASVSLELVDSTGFGRSCWISGSYLDGYPFPFGKSFLNDGEPYDAIVTYDWQDDGVHKAFSITREFHFTWHEKSVNLSAYRYTVSESVTVSQKVSATKTAKSTQTVKQTVGASYRRHGHTYKATATRKATRSAKAAAKVVATGRATRSASASAYLRVDASAAASAKAKASATSAAKNAATATAKNVAATRATASAKTKAQAAAKSAAHKLAKAAALRAAKAKAAK